MVRVQIFSDLHADVRPLRPIRIGDGAEMVIAAGDTCEGAVQAFHILRGLVPRPLPIIMVLGNHEVYRRFWPDELAAARARAAEFGIHLLENDVLTLGGVRFLGATLWTDYALFGADRRAEVMAACRQGMNDHRLIGWRKDPWQRFGPQQALALHQRSRAFLAAAMATPFDGPTVVVTHHAPHRGSLHPHYASDPVSGAFVSDCEDLILQGAPSLWVHGHTHHSADYQVGATRIVCNPHGYGLENSSFDPALIVEVG
jgi:Icc-related predicted phosphoesterase